MSLEKTYRRYANSRRRKRNWAAANPGNMAIRAELLETIVEVAREPLAGGGQILDVGCGGGWLLEQLAHHGVAEERLHGVDLLEQRVEVARRRLPGSVLQVADARELPFADRQFDLVTLLTCLSSMPDRDSVLRALGEARRVLAPGGLLLCYEPRLLNPFNRATLLVSPRLLRAALGPETTHRRLTGFPPAARRLGRLTPRVYPALARFGSTHALTCWQGQGARISSAQR